MAYRARNSAGPRPPAPHVSLSLALSTFVSSIPLAWLSPFMASFPPFPFLLSLSPHPFRPTASRSYISLPPSHSLLRRSRCSVLLSFSSVVSPTCLPPLPPSPSAPPPSPYAAPNRRRVSLLLPSPARQLDSFTASSLSVVRQQLSCLFRVLTFYRFFSSPLCQATFIHP